MPYPTSTAPRHRVLAAWPLAIWLSACSILTDPGSFETAPADSGVADTPREDGPAEDAPSADTERPDAPTADVDPVETCQAAADCAAPRVCDLAAGECRDRPAGCDTCSAQDTCVVQAGGRVECVPCDLDADDQLACDPRCVAPPSECDCDDDGDGFVSPGCMGDVDCDDHNADLRPGLRACGSMGTTCLDPSPMLRPSTGVSSGSFAAFRIDADPESWTQSYRPPVSVVVEEPGRYGVAYLHDNEAGVFRELRRVSLDHTMQAVAYVTQTEDSPIPVMATYMQVRRGPDRQLYVAMMERMDTAERVAVYRPMGTAGCTSTLCSFHSVVSAGEAFHPPLVLGFAEAYWDGVAPLEPRVYWFDQDSVGGRDVVRLRMSGPGREAFIDPIVAGYVRFPAGAGRDLAPAGSGVAIETEVSELILRDWREGYAAWIAPPGGDDVLGCNTIEGCQPIPAGPAAPTGLGGLSRLEASGPPSAVTLDPTGGSLSDANVAGFAPGRSAGGPRELYVTGAVAGCSDRPPDPPCPESAQIRMLSDFTVHHTGVVQGPQLGLDDDLVLIAADQAAPMAGQRELALTFVRARDILTATTAAGVNPVARFPLGMVSGALFTSIHGIDVDVLRRPDGREAELAVLVFGDDVSGEPTMWLFVTRLCFG